MIEFACILLLMLRLFCMLLRYCVVLDTFEWGYVGESGVEVKARNSHSLSIIQAGTSSYLVLYGGASPEHGPLSDTLYALLPDPSSIGTITSTTYTYSTIHSCLG